MRGGTFYLRWYEGSKSRFQQVGQDPREAYLALKRQRSALEDVMAGLAPVPNPELPVVATRKPVEAGSFAAIWRRLWPSACNLRISLRPTSLFGRPSFFPLACASSAVKSLSMDPLHVQPATEQLLAIILMAKHDRAGALEHLRNCLTYFPAGSNLDLVKRQIARIESPVPEKAATSESAPRADGDDVSNVPNVFHDRDRSAAAHSNGSCRIEEVLPQVTFHVEEFVQNVNRFTATEVLVRERLDRNGNIKDKAESKSNYIATIQKMPSSFFVVDEYRDGPQGTTGLAGTIRANVAPALVLIFHPSHIDEFEMACDGPVDWSGYSTWRVDFWQRMDRPATMIGFEVGNKEYTVLLKGSAWINRNTYQIVHMETDLLQSIPDMQLNRLHQSVDYRSVAFTGSAATLWLPQTAEVSADYQGKRLVERHTYSKFQIFSINTEQKINQPANSSN